MQFTATTLSLRISDWISGRRGPEHGEVLLDRKRVYILPTTAGTVFAAAMLVLLIGSINYGLQLGFMLTFLVTSMALVGMHHTHRNLARVTVRGQAAENVHAGDLVTFEFTLTNPTAESRYALQVSLMVPMRRRSERRGRIRAPSAWCDVPANGMQTVRIGMATRRRGKRPCPRIRIETRFPFGLFQAWSYVTPALTAVVYPQSRGRRAAVAGGDGGRADRRGRSRFRRRFRRRASLPTGRPVENGRVAPGRPHRRAVGEAVRGHRRRRTRTRLRPVAAATRHRVAPVAPDRLDQPGRDAAGALALRLPGLHIAIGHGAEHRERCLTALALFKG